MLNGIQHFTDKKDVLIDQLKSKYADLYDAVLPIPYLRDMLYSVEGIFVEGGIEYLEPTNSKGGRTRWRPLKSYQNILNDVKVKSVRRFVEGEPGYGKSMLTLKFAYDWCNESEASPLQNVDILILLRLRQLGGVPSIYTAIKQLLLPKDTTLTEGDIKDILSNSSSVVFMLDGFDELPVKGSDSKSDIINIITKKMFNQFETILTTRSSCLPKEYPPQTIRLRLTGFDNRSRKEYILKAVAGGDKEAADHIRRRLKDNAVLAGVCQVPLFFVMFAHMSHENKHLQRFASVTRFFRHMVSCFHSHMKNKMRDENVTYYDINELDHQKLDKVAFEGLMAKRQQIVWKKVELLNRLGQEFYDQYVRIGILVEENVLHISDKPFTEHIRCETEVRFYHKIFCEWYAAHYLVEILSSENITFNKGFDFFGVDKPYWDSNPIEDKHSQGVNKDNDLGEIDPFDVQYLYRFSCGLSSTAGKQIIESLQKNKEHEKYTLLCILELEGDVRKVIQIVKQLCSTPTEIKAGDTILLQESCIELLKIASQHEVKFQQHFLCTLRSVKLIYFFSHYSKYFNYLQYKSL
ncbi:NACHT, LRR and PYD domains-containing protein 3 [Holothuria leucospilota]|uniref:NACHT, LRR and PYD domains-containing protein 3 n=1 Tax=Holothuria leucospilota TaxID=206669 RepID=A0A9Q1HM10_HOLLE|nr:NACHT, LRR and PYD domains-containing protein 3 [Holothuria leucospilota]